MVLVHVHFNWKYWTHAEWSLLDFEEHKQFHFTYYYYCSQVFKAATNARFELKKSLLFKNCYLKCIVNICYTVKARNFEVPGTCKHNSRHPEIDPSESSPF